MIQASLIRSVSFQSLSSTAAAGLIAALLLAWAPESALAQCAYGPEQCKPGYVWREAFAGDKVCVSGDVRTQAAQDNAAAAQRWTSGAYGPNTCVPGYVWREASPNDKVCVTGAVRTQAAADNAQAAARRDPACAAPATPLPPLPGGVVRPVPGVTPPLPNAGSLLPPPPPQPNAGGSPSAPPPPPKSGGSPPAPPPATASVLVGTGIGDITGPVAEVVMMGYAKSEQSAAGLHMRLYARAFVFAEPGNGKRFVFVSAELGQLFSSVKQGVLKRLAQRYGNLYDERNVQIAATHTHAGPGGYSHHAIFNLTSMGHVAQNYRAIVDGITEAIVQAHERVAPAALSIANGDILEQASINRSPEAFRRNPDIAGLADVEKNMTVLRIDRAGKPAGAIAWFAVHNTSLTNTNLLVSSDHKGWAAHRFEKEFGSIAPLQRAGEFVAAFPNGEEGDQSPNLRKSDGNTDRAAGWVGPAGRDRDGRPLEFESMQEIGNREYRSARALFDAASRRPVAGAIDFRHTFVHMPGYVVTSASQRNGAGNTLCRGAYGASFAAGAEDGPSGAPLFHEGMALGPNLNQAQLTALRVAFTEALFGSVGPAAAAVPGVAPAAAEVPVVGPTVAALMLPLKTALHAMTALSNDPCQFPKPVLIPTGELGWSPEVLPFQLLRVGPVAIAGLPGEMTVQAGRRLKARILNALKAQGVHTVILTGLANEYSGYIATPEEFDLQHYEGASTLFGRLTLDAYIQIFGQLADAMAAGQPVPPGPTPPDLGGRQIELQTGVWADGTPAGQAFGAVINEPPLAVMKGDTVSVRFRGAHPKNDLRRGDSYLRVERNDGGRWVLVAWDSMPETKLRWLRDTTFGCIGCSFIDVIWAVPADAPAGQYRIRHMGAWKHGLSGAITPYEGVSAPFNVGATRTPRASAVSACGGVGQRACCVSERLGSPCDQGLVETGSCTGASCTCGGANPGGTLRSIGICTQPAPAPVVTACGGAGQRACCVGERPGSPCNAGLQESGSCSGAGCTCGGVNPGGALRSIGLCQPQPQAAQATPCGGEGQRACCVTERPGGVFGAACAAGLREAGSCSGAGCTCGGDNPGGIAKSIGMCVR